VALWEKMKAARDQKKIDSATHARVRPGAADIVLPSPTPPSQTPFSPSAGDTPMDPSEIDSDEETVAPDSAIRSPGDLVWDDEVKAAPQVTTVRHPPPLNLTHFPCKPYFLS